MIKLLFIMKILFCGCLVIQLVAGSYDENGGPGGDELSPQLNGVYRVRRIGTNNPESSLHRNKRSLVGTRDLWDSLGTSSGNDSKLTDPDKDSPVAFRGMPFDEVTEDTITVDKRLIKEKYLSSKTLTQRMGSQVRLETKSGRKNSSESDARKSIPNMVENGVYEDNSSSSSGEDFRKNTNAMSSKRRYLPVLVPRRRSSYRNTRRFDRLLEVKEDEPKDIFKFDRVLEVKEDEPKDIFRFDRVLEVKEDEPKDIFRFDRVLEVKEDEPTGILLSPSRRFLDMAYDVSTIEPFSSHYPEPSQNNNVDYDYDMDAKPKSTWKGRDPSTNDQHFFPDSEPFSQNQQQQPKNMSTHEAYNILDFIAKNMKDTPENKWRARELIKHFTHRKNSRSNDELFSSNSQSPKNMSTEEAYNILDFIAKNMKDTPENKWRARELIKQFTHSKNSRSNSELSSSESQHPKNMSTDDAYNLLDYIATNMQGDPESKWRAKELVRHFTHSQNHRSNVEPYLYQNQPPKNLSNEEAFNLLDSIAENIQGTSEDKWRVQEIVRQLKHEKSSRPDVLNSGDTSLEGQKEPGHEYSSEAGRQKGMRTGRKYKIKKSRSKSSKLLPVTYDSSTAVPMHIRRTISPTSNLKFVDEESERKRPRSLRRRSRSKKQNKTHFVKFEDLARMLGMEVHKHAGVVQRIFDNEPIKVKHQALLQSRILNSVGRKNTIEISNRIKDDDYDKNKGEGRNFNLSYEATTSQLSEENGPEGGGTDKESPSPKNEPKMEKSDANQVKTQKSTITMRVLPHFTTAIDMRSLMNDTTEHKDVHKYRKKHGSQLTVKPSKRFLEVSYDMAKVRSFD